MLALPLKKNEDRCVRRGNPKPSIAIDQRAQRQFSEHLRFTLPANATQIGSQIRVFRSQGLELHGFTAPEAFVGITLFTQPPATFALIGQIAVSIGSPGAPGPIGAISTGIFWLGGKNLSGPGTYSLSLSMGPPGPDRHCFASDAWFELWAMGTRGAIVDLQLDGMLVAGRSYGA